MLLQVNPKLLGHKGTISMLKLTKLTKTELLFDIQGQQGLSGHFEMALTDRKKVAKS